MIWNVAPVVNVASIGFSPPTSVFVDISDITQNFHRVKSGSVSQFIKEKLRKLLKYSNGTINSAFDLNYYLVYSLLILSYTQNV